MKRITSIVMALVLAVGLGTVVLPAGSATAAGGTYSVPSGKYPTIQSAIDDALEDGGGTVHVKKGSYSENLTILGTALLGVGKVKELLIIGSGSGEDDLTIMQGGGEDVEGSGLKGGISIWYLDYPLLVQGFTVYNASGSAMRILDSGTYTDIHDCFLCGIAEESGGGMYNGNSSPRVVDCEFDSCNATKFGGGMYNDNSSPVLTGCSFDSNKATSGAGMYNIGSSPVITDCGFDDNVAVSLSANDVQGGAICNVNSSPVLTGCQFGKMIAASVNGNAYGGVMYNENSSPTVDNCYIGSSSFVTSIYANAYGGGICNINSSLEINNCVFGSTFAISTNAESFGGAIYNENSSPTLTGCLLGGTTIAHDFGGGIYSIDSSLLLTDCTVSSYNAKQSGGGIYSEGGTLTLESCTIDNCTAGVSGGGIYILDAPITVTNTVINDNRAVRFGGGVNIYFSDVTDGQAVIKNSIISNNSITSEAGLYNGGGGIAVAGRGVYGWGTLTVVNNIINGNTVALLSPAELAAGGGIRVGGSDYNELIIINSTIVNNSAATMGGIRGGPTTMANSILWGNSSPQLPLGTPVSYSDIEGGYYGTGNIDALPLFVDPAADFHLQEGSPCINAGDNSAVPAWLTTDFEGNPRIINDVVDMGAYELFSELGPLGVFLDIRPGGCPNPLNVNSKGVLPVAILGTADFDVSDIDPESVALAFFGPGSDPFDPIIPPNEKKKSVSDVGTPYQGELVDCLSCWQEGPDGFPDLLLKFDMKAIVAGMGEVEDGACVLLTITGSLYDGTAFSGSDIVRIINKGKK